MNVHIPERSWVDPRVVVRPSPIAGMGLFASLHIDHGEPVARLGGELVTTPKLEARMVAARAVGEYVDTVSVDLDTHLILDPGSEARFGNHSCDPDVWWEPGLVLVARRDIEAGQEITNDYAASTAVARFSMPCNCQRAGCRGVVTGEDWRLPQLQQTYGKHWTPALLHLIETETQREVP